MKELLAIVSLLLVLCGIGLTFAAIVIFIAEWYRNRP